MDLPPNLAIAGGLITTNATANTQTTSTVRVAPGAGLRLRVWYVSISPWGSPFVVPQTFIGLWLDSVTGADIADTSLVGSVLFTLHYPITGGKTLTANAALTLLHFDSLASQTYRVKAGYTVEAF